MLLKLTLPVPALALFAVFLGGSGMTTANPGSLELLGKDCVSVAKTTKEQKTYPCDRVYQIPNESGQSFSFQFIGKDVSLFWVTNFKPVLLDDGTEIYHLKEIIVTMEAARSLGTTTPFNGKAKGKHGDFCMVTPTINAILLGQQGNTKPIPKVACLFTGEGAQVASGILFDDP